MEETPEKKHFKVPIRLGDLLCGDGCGDIIKMTLCPCCGHRDIAKALGKDAKFWCCGTCILYTLFPCVRNSELKYWFYIRHKSRQRATNQNVAFFGSIQSEYTYCKNAAF